MILKTNRGATIWLRIAGAFAALAGFAPAANAATEQILSVFFRDSGPVVPAAAAAVPLSPWATAGIIVMLAVCALMVLRRHGARANRLFGWMVALVAVDMLLATSGQRAISEARAALPPPQVFLVTSPGTLDVGPYFDESFNTQSVTVTNTRPQPVVIISITLDPGPYRQLAGGCAEGQTLNPQMSCTISLEPQEG